MCAWRGRRNQTKTQKIKTKTTFFIPTPQKKIIKLLKLISKNDVFVDYKKLIELQEKFPEKKIVDYKWQNEKLVKIKINIIILSI